MDTLVKCSIFVRNVSENHYKYIIIKFVDNAWWYYGSDKNKDNAYDIANKITNSNIKDGIVAIVLDTEE